MGAGVVLLVVPVSADVAMGLSPLVEAVDSATSVVEVTQTAVEEGHMAGDSTQADVTADWSRDKAWYTSDNEGMMMVQESKQQHGH